MIESHEFEHMAYISIDFGSDAMDERCERPSKPNGKIFLCHVKAK